MSDTTAPGAPTTEQLAAGYREARAQAVSAYIRIGALAAGLLLAVVFVCTVWTALDPQPGPLADWVQAAGPREISGAFAGSAAAVGGLLALGLWTGRTTVPRVCDPARPGWARCGFAAVLAAALLTGMSPDPTLHLVGVLSGLLVLRWVDGRLHHGRLRASPTPHPEPDGEPVPAAAGGAR